MGSIKEILKRNCIIVMILIITIVGIPMNIFASEVKYAIQMGNFIQESSAIEVENKMRDSGINPIRIKQKNYIVFYGIYNSKEDAQANLQYARQIESGAYIVTINASEDGISKDETKPVATPKPVATTKPVVKPKPVSTPKPIATPKAVAEPTQMGSLNEPLNSEIKSQSNEFAYNQSISGDNILTGVYGSSSIFFTISENWQLKANNYFDLYFKHSVGDKNRGSSITVEVNTIPITSFFIDNLKEDENFKRINIPKEYLKVGFNEVKIKTYHRITDFICEDDMNPANWITIAGKSYIHLEYMDNNKDIKISRYPFPYVKEYKDLPIEFTFLTDSNKPSVQELKTMSILSANIGRKVRFKDMKFKMQSIGEMDSSSNYIYIGTKLPEKLKSYSKFNLEDNTLSYIGQLDLENSKKLLFLISENENNIPIMAKKLSNEQIKDQMNDYLITLQQDDIVEGESVEIKNTFSFEELGYDNVYLEGAKTSVAQFFVDIPGNWKLEDGSKIVLKTRYSKVIKFDKSSVSVVINGVPVGSQILKQENAEEDMLTFNIPREFRDQKSLAVTIRVYLDGDFDCKDGSVNPNFWFYISKDSTVYIPHIPRNNSDLTAYPTPFSSDFALKNVNFVFDETYNPKDIEMMLDMTAYMSRGTTICPDIEISLGKIIPNENNILIGLLDTKLLKDINEKLNIPYLYNESKFKDTKDHILIDSFNKNLATGQLIMNSDSPYATLVISASKYEDYKNIAPFFISSAMTSKLYGDTVFVDSKGYYQIFETRKQPQKEVLSENVNLEEPDTKGNTQVRVSYQNVRNFIIFLTALFVVVIILIIVIRDRNKKRKI